MSRRQKIELILHSRSSLPLYKDLSEIPEHELNREIRMIMSRLATNESRTIAQMQVDETSICLN